MAPNPPAPPPPPFQYLPGNAFPIPPGEFFPRTAVPIPPIADPEAPAPDFNALLDETFAQEDALRPLHSSMTIVDEAGFSLYQ